MARVVGAGQGDGARGYTFDAADASFELLLREEVDGRRPAYFEVETWRVITDSRPGGSGLRGHREAASPAACGRWRPARGTVRSTRSTTRCGRRCCGAYPELDELELIDFRVRILDAAHGTDAVTRVLIETADGATSWETVGVAGNILEASWEALVDGLDYGLLRAGVEPR